MPGWPSCWPDDSSASRHPALSPPNPPLADTYAIGEVAAMVGLSAHTIRAWERRYGVVKPVRAASGQRRYLIEEVETLKRVKDLASARGLSLRLAAASAQGDLPDLEAAGFAITPEVASESAADGGPWRAVADLDPRLLLVLDGRGLVVDCNIAFARVSGRLRFELAGTRFADFVDPYDRAKAVAIFRGTPQQRRGYELNLRTEGATGLFRFDCFPFRFRERWLIACAGRDVSLTV